MGQPDVGASSSAPEPPEYDAGMVIRDYGNGSVDVYDPDADQVVHIDHAPHFLAPVTISLAPRRTGSVVARRPRRREHRRAGGSRRRARSDPDPEPDGLARGYRGHLGGRP
jgi:hypothetical protein